MGKEPNIPQSTLDEQLAASNPKSSAWVSANAGSGKTHVLTQRVIRLMLDGNAPSRILCLTFTKAAAANMKNRVFSTLARWTVIPEIELKTALEKTTGEIPKNAQLRRARQLFAEALDTPGGLKIQTIHGFCESLLHQFPLEANVSGHFEVLQDTAQIALLEEAKSQVFSGRSGDDITTIFDYLIAHQSDFAIDEALSEIISKRQTFLNWAESREHLALRLQDLYQALDLIDGVDETNVIADLLEQANEHREFLNAVALEGAAIGGNSTKSSSRIINWLEAKGPKQAFDAVVTMCLTDKNTVRTGGGLGNAELKTTFPNFVDTIANIGEECLRAGEYIKRITLYKNSAHLFTLAFMVLDQYERLKRSRGLIDYDDQIQKTVNLLNRSEIRDWIRYRLDSGIDHVLVDEAQDTSPTQWEIINAVTADFFSGENAAKKERTIFVVGDEKQSIYSFQGADPAEFAIQERQLRKNNEKAGKNFYPAKLALSFRSTPDVLKAVDEVFKSENTRTGLTRDNAVPVHNAIRSSEPGDVRVWPLFAPAPVEKTENWLDPIDRESEGDPAVQLAQRVTDTIGEWVGTTLPGMDTPLTFGDILVLVRKRDRFITALTRTMKDAGLSVAGSDRLNLLEHIAVEDLLALGRFILLPNDDLNLAAVLKGPLFSWTEEALFDLANMRGEISLYQVLQDVKNDVKTPRHETFTQAANQLDNILKQGNSRDVLGFYLWVLGVAGARKSILARLGNEAEDVLDAFMDEILDFQRNGGLGLEAFITRLTKANPVIKRELELDRDEVRILTVHSSKGLEARVVFLVDPSNPAWSTSHRSKIPKIEFADNQSVFAWVPTIKDQTELSEQSTLNEQLAAEAEYRRLLYVGMTRAADRLVICGYHGKHAPKHEHWHTMVTSALEKDAEHVTDEDGNLVELRWFESSPPSKDVVKEKSGQTERQDKIEFPNWLYKPAASERSLPRPLTPSGAFALIDRDMKASRAPAFEEDTAPNTFGLEVGNVVHQLLESLPDIPQQEREERARNYIYKIGSNWSKQTKEKIVNRVLGILNDPKFSFLFTSKSRSEVPITGKLEMKDSTRLISGQIDRLVIGEKDIHIIDFKSNRIVPADISEIPPQYVSQLALYRHIITNIYPMHTVHCALLWINRPRLDFLPFELLNQSIEEIKNK